MECASATFPRRVRALLEIAEPASPPQGGSPPAERASGQDCGLKRYGQRLAQRGGKPAKKRAVVAVARKLPTLLPTLWKHGRDYGPFHRMPQEA